MSYAAEVLADSPVGYWRLGEASGLPQDSSGNLHHCTGSLGTAIYAQPGALAGDADTAIKFTGTQNFSVPDGVWLDFADVFTLEAWIKRNSATLATQAWMGRDGGFEARLSTDNYVHYVNPGVADVARSNVQITDTTTWHHVVITKNGATVAIYIDGTEGHTILTPAVQQDSNLPFFIGCQHGTVDPANLVIDEVALYPTALSAARVAAHYQAGITAAAAAASPHGNIVPVFIAALG